jgi:hypothetical protein
MRNNARYADPDLDTEHKHGEQAPVKTRLPSALDTMAAHRRTDPCTFAGRKLREALLRHPRKADEQRNDAGDCDPNPHDGCPQNTIPLTL